MSPTVRLLRSWRTDGAAIRRQQGRLPRSQTCLAWPVDSSQVATENAPMRSSGHAVATLVRGLPAGCRSSSRRPHPHRYDARCDSGRCWRDDPLRVVPVASAAGAPTPFSCTQATVSRQCSRRRRSASTALPASFSDVGTASGWKYNAIGYDSQDNFIYAASLNSTFPGRQRWGYPGPGVVRLRPGGVRLA
jgi:hypothetical protein